LSLLELQRVIAKENQNVSGGAIRMGDGRFQLRVPGEFRSPEEIYGLVIGLHNGQPVYLKDAARVVDGFKDEMGRSRLNGYSAINIQVKKRTGENILEISDRIDRIVEEQKHSWPSGTTLVKVMDDAKDIRGRVASLENNILSGLILVIIVLFFVMGIRNAILVGMAIPFSMFISFAVLNALGISLNMVTLFSLTLALGMLVDNAIVIVENIFRFMEQGVPRIEAAMRATSEVAQPVIASTLTTVAAFSPLIFWPGIMGQFMSYLPKVVIITLLASLFVAMVINPALAAIFLKLPHSHRFTSREVTVEEIEQAGEAPISAKGPYMKHYKKLLESSLNHRAAVLIIAFLAVVSMVMIWYYRIGIEKPIEFFPNMAASSINLNMDVPEGANLNYSDRISRQIELAICEGEGASLAPPDAHPERCYYREDDNKIHTLGRGQQVTGLTDLANIKDIYSRTVAVVGGGASFMQMGSPNHIGIEFHDLEDRVEPISATIDTIRERIANIAGAQITIEENQMKPPTGTAIHIEILGDNFDVLGKITREVRDILQKIPFVRDINDNYIAGAPTVKVRVDRQKAALLGLSTELIGFALKVAFNGIKVSTYREGNEDFDITVQLPDSDRKVTDILRELLIPTAKGLVPLSTVTRFEITGGLGRINRVDHERAITIRANVDEEHIPGPVVRAQAEKILAGVVLPQGYKIRFAGESMSQEESQTFLSRAFVIAIFLIFLILITQFNSVAQPLIIVTSIFLSLGGVFLGLSVLKAPFNIVMNGVGIISLAGVVVNNAIVLIDYTNRLHERGLPFREAITAASCTRLRPVLLTAITTILGLLPMATGVSFDFHTMRISWISEATMMWQTMASAVIFGLALATILTLLVVPCLYALIYTGSMATQRGTQALRRAYWAPFYRFTGSSRRAEER
ncbi:MAG: efflux RND transporter permease subunit, partial [Desulfobacterales bacterium]